MEKVRISHETSIEDLQLNNDRAPNYLGLLFYRYKLIVPSSPKIVKSANHPRMVEKKTGNCDTISASLKRGWAKGDYPPSFTLKNGKLKIINGNIFFFAYEQADIIASPAAIPIDPPIKLKSKIATTIFFDFKVPDATITESFKLFF